METRAGPRDVVAGGALKAEVLNRALEAARFRREGGGEYESWHEPPLIRGGPGDLPRKIFQNLCI